MSNVPIKVIFAISSSINVYSLRVYFGLKLKDFSSVWHTCVLQL